MAYIDLEGLQHKFDDLPIERRRELCSDAATQKAPIGILRRSGPILVVGADSGNVSGWQPELWEASHEIGASSGVEAAALLCLRADGDLQASAIEAESRLGGSRSYSKVEFRWALNGWLVDIKTGRSVEMAVTDSDFPGVDVVSALVTWTKAIPAEPQ